MKNNSNYQNENTNAICSLDFSTAFDAYNYAMAHRLDTNPLAVAINQTHVVRIFFIVLQ